eukprot:scaffold124878_cov63-Phaeocystis_antarctica.AAC.4
MGGEAVAHMRRSASCVLYGCSSAWTTAGGTRRSAARSSACSLCGPTLERPMARTRPMSCNRSIPRQVSRSWLAE